MTNDPNEPAGSDWAEAMNEQNGKSASFTELGAGATDEEGSRTLDFLLDIPLEVTVELGRTKMIINDMLQLTQGSVVELSKNAGETVEIFVNNKLLGKGEVIVVNDRFGVRITEIISQAERVKNIV
ncbi:MAG: flagellar motor switch protein FliN [Desulfobacteraceae bacterium]|nr:flagellar motor switch protein FliN [Desulfobacteraceae bacterium]